MNTANLQLEGLYAALAALLTAIRQKDLLTEEEIDSALEAAERTMVADPGRPSEVSPANVEAICFPIRYLRAANRLPIEGGQVAFSQLATHVGQTRPRV